MSQSDIRFTVFTKPWKVPLPELGQFVKKLGFDGIELPVRPGFQVEPEKVGAELPKAATRLAEFGLKIDSVAGPTDEATIAACAEAGVPIIRICVAVPKTERYLDMERRVRAEFDRLVPLLDRHGVTIGIQNHCDRQVPNALGVLHLIEKYDAKHIAAVWDPAHCALNGEIPELAIDILWDRLCMVNLKNGIWRKVDESDPDKGVTWKKYWTSGREGLAPWATVAAELRKRKYRGPVCLTAEYSDHSAVDRLIAEDIAFAKSLFAD